MPSAHTAAAICRGDWRKTCWVFSCSAQVARIHKLARRGGKSVAAHDIAASFERDEFRAE